MNVSKMEFLQLTTEEVTKAIRDMKTEKAPGTNKVCFKMPLLKEHGILV